MANEVNSASSSVNYEYVLHPLHLQDMVRSWLKEDVPNFDYGGFIVGERIELVTILCKSPGVLAGIPFVNAIFKELECQITWLVPEGSYIEPEPVTKVAELRGKVRHLLLGERVALNCLSCASGIATGARKLRKIANDKGWSGEIAGTRKTTPGFRMVEKYSLMIGGVSTHRYDLSSMVMIKDNHIWSAGDISQAVKDARHAVGFSTKIEVECRSCTEALQAAGASCDVIMLDNFQPQALHDTATIVKSKYPHILVEASGGINEDTLSDYFGKHIDVISLGKLTQGYDTVDFSFKICKAGRDPSNPKVTS